MTCQNIQPQKTNVTPQSEHISPAAYIGIDVAKTQLVIAHNGQVTNVANSKRDLQSWLGTLPPNCALALEATSSYHQLLADMAYAAGHTVYVLNPKQIKHYRTATRGRAKTDLCDALLLARYLEREYMQHHPYQPLSPDSMRLCSLLRRRAAVVKSKILLRLSLEGEAKALGLGTKLTSLLDSYKRLLKAIDLKIDQLLKKPQFEEAAGRLLSIVGIGPLSGAALLVALERGEFKTPEAFVAFFGLDPVSRDSGQSNGRRRLSKQGDSETRRLLYNAAMSASLTELWRPLYLRYLNRGFTRIQTLCIMARKLDRIAWALYKKKQTFCAQKFAKSLT